MISPSIAITGLGIVCGAGAGHEAFWSALVAGTSTIRPIERFDASGFACGLASEVPAGIGAKDYVPKHYRKAVKVMARDSELAVVAAALAVKDAKLTTRMHIPEEDAQMQMTYAGDRMGCQIGAGLLPAEIPEIAGAFATARDMHSDAQTLARTNGFSLRAWGTVDEGGKIAASGGTVGGMNNLQPLWLLKYLPNMLACHVTIIHGAEGPSNTITCSEASGLLCIGESARVIERGAADICFSGGAESKVNHMGMARTQLLGRLAPWRAGEERAALRPYDSASAGTVHGEGGGILILERDDLAAKRGVTRYAILAGFGAAHGTLTHIAKHNGKPMLELTPRPKPLPSGLALAILSALRDAGITADEVDAIVPQAAGVSDVDAAELAALKEVFGQRLANIAMVTLAPMLGDCAAGAGGLQVAAAALCLHHQMLPARLHGGSPDAAVQAQACPSRSVKLSYVLVCTGSLAGQNAAVVLKRA